MSSPPLAGCWRCGGEVTAVSQFCPTCGAPQRASSNPAGAATPPGWNASSSDPFDLLTSELVAATAGEYEIIRPLGRGGQAAVFLATELALGRRVALKVMAPEVMSLPGMLERFYAEAVTQANLTHPNIVSVYAVRRGERLNFFTMQYLAGRSLQQAIRACVESGRAIAFDVVRGILYQVGSALGYAHRRGVIHRDVKPGNVMLTPAGDAIVTDFGIAKVLTSDSLTMTGAIFGTASYMSPEQCNSERPTGASDQYSLGIVAYELLTGALPFSGNAFALMHAHGTQQPPPISLSRPDCPPVLEAAVMRMLAKTPAERFPDVGAALDAMGAGPVSQSPDDAVRKQLVDFAVGDLHPTSIDDLIRVPISPSPRSRSSDARPRTQESLDSPPPHVAPPVERAPALAVPEVPLGASALFLPHSGDLAPPSGTPESFASVANVGIPAEPRSFEESPSPQLPSRRSLQRIVGISTLAVVGVVIALYATTRAGDSTADQSARANAVAPADSDAPTGAVGRVASPDSGGSNARVDSAPEVGPTRPPRQTAVIAPTDAGRSSSGANADRAQVPTTRRRPDTATAGHAVRDASKDATPPSIGSTPATGTITTGASAAVDPKATSGATERVSTPETHEVPDAAPVLDALVDRCHFALSSASESKVDELFGRGGNDATRDLRTALKAQPSVGGVSDKVVIRDESTPVAEFAVAISWHNNFGATIRERYVIRARASLSAGVWQPLGCVVASRTRLK